jgi:O-antigen/teichoic acid export membrane protein
VYSTLSKRQLLTRVFSHAWVYGVGIVLVRAGGILLLPLYWLKLSPDDFGIIGLSQALMSFLSPILALGLYDAVQRLFHEWRPSERPEHLGLIWIFSNVVGLAICLLLTFVGPYLFGSILSQVPFYPYLSIAIWTAFATNLSLMPLAIMRALEESRRYALITIFMFLSQAALAISLVFVAELGPAGYLAAALINGSLWSIYFIAYMIGKIRWSTRWQYLGEAMRYALPIVPASLLEGVSQVVDRYFLDKFVGLRQIGLYTLANQIGGGFNVFNQTIKNSWYPFIYRVVTERQDAPSVVARLSLYLVAALVPIAVAIALLAREVIILVGDERYHGVYELVPVFVSVYFMHACWTVLGRGMDLAKRLHYTPLVQIAGLITGTASLWWLVPAYGVWGAIAGLVIANVTKTIALLWLSFYFYPRPLLPGRYASLAVIAVAMYWAGTEVSSASLAVSAAAKLAVVAAGSAFIFWFVLDGRRALDLFREWRNGKKTRRA